MLTVCFSHGLMDSGKLAGICVVPCKDIPEKHESQSDLFDTEAVERKVVTLRLLSPAYSAKTELIRAEIKSRASLGDSNAKKFTIYC